MYVDNGKISARQTFRLFVFDFMGIATLLLPPYLSKLCGVDGIWVILIGSILGFVYLLYLKCLMKKMCSRMVSAYCHSVILVNTHCYLARLYISVYKFSFVNVNSVACLCSINYISNNLSVNQGAYVAEVSADSPAEKAGIKAGDIVIAMIEDEATCKRFRKDHTGVWLLPENPNYAPIDGTNAVVLGKVKAVLREY